MTLTLALLVACLAALVFLLLGAQIELHRDVAQLREYGGLIDRPSPLDIGVASGAAPSVYGLPGSLDSARSAVVLFVSDKCATCRSIVANLNGILPPGLTIVLGVGDDPDGVTLQYGLDRERTVLDVQGGITERLGLRVLPAAVIVGDGCLLRATTVPSSRQLYMLLESATPSDREPIDLSSATKERSL